MRIENCPPTKIQILFKFLFRGYKKLAKQHVRCWPPSPAFIDAPCASIAACLNHYSRQRGLALGPLVLAIGMPHCEVTASIHDGVILTVAQNPEPKSLSLTWLLRSAQR